MHPRSEWNPDRAREIVDTHTSLAFCVTEDAIELAFDRIERLFGVR